MSDKPLLHTFSATCKSKPVYNYTITEHEIKSLQHNNKIETSCDALAGFLIGVVILVVVWMINYDDDNDWKKIPALSISVVLLVFVVILSAGANSNSKEIWKNIQQVSEVICEKK